MEYKAQMIEITQYVFRLSQPDNSLAFECYFLIGAVNSNVVVATAPESAPLAFIV